MDGAGKLTDRLGGWAAFLLFVLMIMGGSAHILQKFGLPLAEQVFLLKPVCALVAVIICVAWLRGDQGRRWHVLSWGWLFVPSFGAALCGFSVLYAAQLDVDWGTRPILEKIAVVLGGPVLLILIPRYLHLLSAAIRQLREALAWHGLPGLMPPLFEAALPSHKEVIAELMRGTGTDPAHPISPHAKTIALRAGWGVGKTACLRAFQHKVLTQRGADKMPFGAVIWFDCWRHQADPQPEFALYWQMAQDWRMLWPFGWLVVPAFRTYLTLFPVIAKATLDIGKAKLEVDDKALREVPRALFWQRHLEALVRMTVSRYGRVVLVMEDIDRCTIPSAQRFVTLVRRFLAVPGLSIIVPFVEEQFRPKVFDPLNAQLPDLAATTDAVLWRWYGASLAVRPKAAVAGEGSKPSEGGASTIPSTPAPTLSPIEAALNLYQPKLEEKPADGVSDNAMRLIRPDLLKRFAQAEIHERERIFALLEEKYLCDHIVLIPPLNGADIAQLTLGQLKDLPEWLELAKTGGAGDAEWGDIETFIKSHFDRHVLPPLGLDHGVTARQFIGALSMLLPEVGKKFIRLRETIEAAAATSLAGRFATLAAHMAFDLAANRTNVSNRGDAL